MNQTLIEKVRCILSQAGLSKAFWAEALSYAVHLVNRLPVSGNGGRTPLETQSWILEQKKPSLWALAKKIENNDEALKQVEKVVFSPDVVAPTEEPIDQVNNNFDVLEQKEQSLEEQSLVNERVEEPESIAKNRPRRVIRKPARFDDTIAYASSIIDGVPNLRIEA
ncbi:uncharacterized protein LOC111473221 [Cucurbita maxima]|uniref:Uncharacterized protein LOC111473221 n=1 Tax=Cucurbita maxima TaxID=3661 RepID=A0A6J1IGL4_CUCMA|nr:uncharacterized protein LOC111473221 [Cucurbita maxima]